MKGTKHKIFILAEPLKCGKFMCFLFQSGDIGNCRGTAMDIEVGESLAVSDFCNVASYSYPQLVFPNVRINGHCTQFDFKIVRNILTIKELDKLKELEYAYNNR